MSIKIRRYDLAGGEQGLYLDIYERGKRTRRKLGLRIWEKPKTPLQKHHNSETLKLAEVYRAKQVMGEVELNYNPQADFCALYDRFMTKYDKKDIKHVKRALFHFKEFTKREVWPVGNLTPNLIMDFADYLKSKGTGEGPSSAYYRFMKVVRRLIEDGVVKLNLAKVKVKFKTDGNLSKAILNPKEIVKLAQTECSDLLIKKAFLFCLQTGLGKAEVRSVEWSDIDGERMIQPRSKTRQTAFIPLNSVALKILDSFEEKKGKVFKLPPDYVCTDVLTEWVKKAGIKKKITWHCARHSTGVNLLLGGADIRTVAGILGHSEKSGFKHTFKYTRYLMSQAKQAVDTLPDIDF